MRPNMNSIMDPTTCQQMAEILSTLLADTYVLYVKTQNFHWNIVDARFYSLHKMLENQYEELEEAIDIIAERIRMLGHKSPGSMRQFLEMATLQEASGEMNANEMLDHLLLDREKTIASLRQMIHAAEELGDQGTMDMLIDRLREHEKTAWMLRSHFLNMR